MTRTVTKEQAERIAKKFKANIVRNRPNHDLAEIVYKGTLVASFGLRRGSSKDLGHPHVPDRLYLSLRETVRCAECTFSVDDWVKKMKKDGKIPKDEDEEEEELD